jgi:bacillithiol biosynthesis deacetylase BshB1
MSKDKLNWLSFGAHPDDVEIGMGGSIAKHSSLGARTGICDLTRAELSSNGTVETRQKEAEQAGEILGLHTRINLAFPDRGLSYDENKVRAIATIIRTYQPEIIFVPYPEDRHPDHRHCATLVEEAVFSSGIRRYEDHQGLPSHKVNRVYYYMINGFHKPDFVVDISDYMDDKLKALKAYASQFVGNNDSVTTPLTNGYIETVQSRERLFGKEVGVTYAEGFKAKGPILLNEF